MLLKNQFQIEIKEILNAEKRLQLTLLIIFISMIVVIAFIYWILQNHFGVKFKELCLVFKSIPEPYIEHYIQKVESFKKYI